MDNTGVDAKGVIREAYRIDGITDAQCRSIFLDWALSLSDGIETSVALNTLLMAYGDAAPDHPMTQVLRQGLTKITNPRRRGGWRSRSRE